jgi:Sulfotransferase family
MMEPFESASVSIGDAPPREWNGPLFVVGMFRSGTSLLYALLNQHPQIALMYEGDLAHLQALFWVPRDTTRWLKRWEFWNGALARHKFDASATPDGIRDLRGAMQSVYSAYAHYKKGGAPIWGCKSPTYSDEVIRLSRVFPEARFLIIWRDLRHICRSILAAAETSPFFNRRGMVLRAILGYHELKTQCDAIVRAGARVHHLNYEELVRDPVGSMRAICVFLDIPYDAKMTNLRQSDRTAISDFRHHSLVKGEEIVTTRNGSAGLRPELRDKIERYTHLWREQNAGSWPAYPQHFEGNPRNPSIGERVSDAVAYQLFKFVHHLAPVVFAFVPLNFWRRYRRYITVKRIQRLLEKAGSDKERLLKKISVQDQELLRAAGVDDDFLRKAGIDPEELRKLCPETDANPASLS